MALHNNSAPHFGGAVYTANANLTISNCHIYQNTARDGGGIAIQNSANKTITITNTSIHHNEADWGGAIRLLHACNVVMSRLLIYDNVADHGGGINCYGNGVTLSLDHATIHGNNSTDCNGGGLKMWGATSAAIINTIFDANLPNNINNRSAGSSINISYSDIAQGQQSVDNPYQGTLTYGDGMIYADPLFGDPDAFDFHLTANSPCIDAGDPNGAQEADGSEPDIGYYYFHQQAALVVAVTYPNGGETFTVGQAVTITWTSQGGAGVNHSAVSYSFDGGNNCTAIGQTQGNDFDLIWVVPNLTGNCLIRVVVTDNSNQEASDQSDASFTVTPMRLEQSLAAGWSFISIPLIQDNMSVQAVLLDDIDGQYAIYGFEPDQGHTVPQTLANAKGYFLGLHAAATLDVVGLPNDNDSHTFNLALGWNVLGGPFAVATPLANATVIHTTDQGAQTFTFAEAVDEEILSPIMYNFFDNEPEGEPDWPQGNHYLEHDAFQLWRGYWYMCMASGVQLVVPNPQAGNPAPPRDEADDSPEHDWYLQFLAANEETGDIARLGVNRQATAGFDNRFDYPEPPVAPTENTISLYFVHQDWQNPNATNFNRDIRPPMNRGDSQEWTLTVECSQAGEVSLLWPEIVESTPWMNEYTLVDAVDNVEVNLREDYVYTFQCDGARQFVVRALSSLDAPETALTLPTGCRLTSVYPNPFNASTTLNFTVSGEREVAVSIFDLEGGMMAELFRGMAGAGKHSLTWNALDCRSGVYFARFETAGVTQTRRLMLVK